MIRDEHDDEAERLITLEEEDSPSWLNLYVGGVFIDGWSATQAKRHRGAIVKTIASALRAAAERARGEEREAIAKMHDAWAREAEDDRDWGTAYVHQENAKSIRARGEGA